MKNNTSDCKPKLKDVIWIRNNEGNILNNTENLNLGENLLNKTGPGFCLAKFTQVTIHLGTGQVHSCHHPKTHEIPLEEIADNPGALFNTQHLKQARREMLEGKRPSECDYCWRVEDSKGPSDRFFKSIESWALHEHDKIVEQGSDVDYYPTYLEVDFSNVCNFNCIYCGPEYSSTWVDDLKRNGPVKVLDGTKYVQWIQGWQNLEDLTYKNKEFNPYVDAFWKWFPKAYSHLKFYRITGGEPLLSKETFKSIDWLISNPNPDLDFSINSNLGAPEKVWREFLKKIKILIDNNSVKKFTLFTSVDAWGERAEYLRVGLNFETFKKRYEEVLKLGGIRVVIMCAFNILSMTSIKKLLEWQSDLRSKYNVDKQILHLENEFKFNLGGEYSHVRRKEMAKNHFSIIGIDVPYLRHPECLDAHFSDKNLIENFFVPAVNFAAKNTSNPIWGMHQGFEEYEVEKLKRILIEVMHYQYHQGSNKKVLEHRAKFYDFVNDIDRRTGKDFLKVFPEMEEFYNLCKNANDQIRKEES